MFATLRTSNDKELVCVEHVGHSLLNGQGQQHSACGNCRAKKLKCTGRKSGCDRCLLKGIPCVYPSAVEMRTSKRRRSTRDATTSEDSARIDKSASIVSSDPSATSARSSCDGRVSLPHEALATIQSNRPTSTSDTQNSHGDRPAGNTLPNLTGHFTEVLESIGLNVESGSGTSGLGGRGGKDERMATLSAQTNDMEGIGSLTFSSDTSSFLTMTEDVVGFDFDFDLGTNLNEASIDMGDTRKHDAAGNLTCSLSGLPSPLSLPLHEHSPVANLSGSPGRIWQSVQGSGRQSAAPSTASGLNHVTGPLVAGLANSTSTATLQTSACQCMHTALAILENLESNTSKESLFSVDHTLSFKKRALAQCNAMLDCRNCNAASGFMMLLIVICEHMVSSFGQLTAGLQEQLQQQQSSKTFVDKMMIKGVCSEFRPSIFFGEYEVDLVEERRCLLTVLVILQLKSLERLLTRLKSITTLWNWETHRRKLALTDEKFREAAANIRRMNRS